MWRNDETLRSRFELRDLLKPPDSFHLGRTIDEQQMPPVDRAFDAGNDQQAAVSGVRHQRRNVQLLVVQRDRQGLIAKLRRPVNQVPRGMRDELARVVCRVGMQVDFQHAR